MAGFLSGLGDIGAGLAPYLSQIADQQNSNQSGNALGGALASLFGGQQQSPTGQSSAGPMGSIGTLLQSLSGGSQMPAAQPQASPQPAPGGAQPMVAQAGGGLPGQASAQGQQPPAQPQPPPQPQGQPPQARPAPQQQGQPGSGQLDIPTLVKELTKRGVQGHRMVDAVSKALPMLNAQGLQQYRQLGIQLRAENQQNQETQRQYNRDPDAAGSTAQNRVAGQGIALKRMDAVKERFQARMDAATDKLKNAKTDKDALEAKKDLDKTRDSLNQELKSELNYAMAPGTPAEEQKAAMQKAAEIRQQIEASTNEAIKARRSGGASGDQVGGAPAPDKATPDKSGGDTFGKPKPVKYKPDGTKMVYKGTGDQSDPANWEEDGGGQ